jgi:signal transduction histidine kinase
VLRERRSEDLQAMVRDRRNRITITPLIDEEDRLVGTLHILSDRTEQQVLEDQHEEATSALERTSEQLHQQLEGRREAEQALSQAHTRMEKQAADNLSALAKLQGTLRSTEKALNKSEKALAKLQVESKVGRFDAAGRLAGGVAAQLNEWLSGILGSTDIGLTQLEASYPGHGELTAVQRLTKKAVEWTGRLASLQRRALPAAQAVDLNALISGQSKVLDRLAGEGVDLELDLSADLPAVRGQPHLLEHALLNLAEQARRAMPESGVLRFHTETTKVRASQTKANPEAQAGKHVLLTVSDNSAGMEPEALEHLFEPFAPAAAEGNPLGMAEVFSIARQHGGWIEVRSEPGHGTRYDIYLPLHKAEDE